MISAVDTNILLDILLPDEEYYGSSKALLEWAYSQGGLVICETVYTELLAQFGDPAEGERFLTETNIRLSTSESVTLREASRTWKKYLQRRGPHLQCPQCGAPFDLHCSQCGGTLRPRRRVAGDFIIGAHAMHQADCLLSRDQGFYRDYFTGLRVMDRIA